MVSSVSTCIGCVLVGGRASDWPVLGFWCVADMVGNNFGLEGAFLSVGVLVCLISVYRSTVGSKWTRLNNYLVKFLVVGCGVCTLC